MSFLPELVIVEIFKHVNPGDHTHPGKIEAQFRTQLPLLAINRQWRQTGEPIVYRTAYLYAKWGKLRSNLDLIVGNPLSIRLRVQSLCINLLFRGGFYDYGIGQVIQQFSSRSVDWPEGYKLVDLKRKIDAWDNYDGRGLDDRLLERAQEHIAEFAQMLPAISRLELLGYCSSGVHMQLSSTLIQAFASQLKVLWAPALLDIPEFPRRLTFLRYHSRNRQLSQIPRIDPGFLETLSLQAMQFSSLWSIFQPIDNRIVFDKLHSLSLGRYYVTRQTHPPASVAVELPRLRHLELHYGGKNSTVDFWPSVLPSRLDTANFKLHLFHLRQLHKSLSMLESIGRLMISVYDTVDLSQAYESAAWFLGEIHNPEGTWLYFSPPIDGVEPGQLRRWRNVRGISLYRANQATLNNILVNMPWLDTLSVAKLAYSSTDRNGVIPCISNSKIKELSIMEVVYRLSSDGLIQYILELVKQLQNVQVVRMAPASNLQEEMSEMIQKSYPQLNDLTIY